MKSAAVWLSLALVLFVVLLAGCRRSETSHLDRWTEEIGDVSKDDAAQRLEELRRKGGLPLSFWAGDGAQGNPAVEAIRGEHPCGAVALAFVEKMPPYEPGAALESELIAEIGPGGEVLRTWSAPVDVIVEGIRGDEILFSESFDRRNASPLSVRLSVRPDGSYRVEPRRPALGQPEAIACPTLDLWGESAYVRCWVYRDAKTGRERTLAYQGPCT